MSITNPDIEQELSMKRHLNRVDAVTISRSMEQIRAARAYLESLSNEFFDTWALEVPKHESCPFAATAMSAVPGRGLLVFSVNETSVDLEVVEINRIEMHGADDESVEPVVVTETGAVYAWPSLGLVPDYGTGEWGKTFSVIDEVHSIIDLFLWLESEYGQKAEPALSLLIEHLVNEYGVIAVRLEEASVAQNPEKNFFHC